MPSRYEVIEKIRKLFALGDVNQSHTSEGEATNAMKLGLKMMYEHKISPVEIFGTQQQAPRTPSFDDVFGSRACTRCPQKDKQIQAQSHTLDEQRIKLRDVETRLRASETAVKRQQQELDFLKTAAATAAQPAHMPDIDLLKDKVKELADLLSMTLGEDHKKPFKPLVPKSVSEPFILEAKSILLTKPHVLDNFEKEFLASVIVVFDRGFLLTEKQQATLQNVVLRLRGRSIPRGKAKVNRGKPDVDDFAEQAAEDFEKKWKESNAHFDPEDDPPF